MILQAVLEVLVTGRVNHAREAASELSDKEAAKLNPKVLGDPCRWSEWHRAKCVSNGASRIPGKLLEYSALPG
jgi:hypothetical protein